MTDGSFTNTGIATNSGTDQWVELDLGANYLVGSTFIGTATNNIPGGWSKTYTENCVLSYSSDRAVWIPVRFLDTFPANGIYEVPTPFFGQYLRVTRRDGSWIALSELSCSAASVLDSALLEEDLRFGSVALLLRGNGADAGSVFTDSSGYNRSVSNNGSTVRTRTDQSRFDGSSLRFLGDGGTIAWGSTKAVDVTGDFTVEAWVRTASTSDQIIGGSDQENVQIFRLNEGGEPNRISFYAVNQYVFQNLSAPTIPDTWMHLAISRTGNTTRYFHDGTAIGINTSWTGRFSFTLLGSMFSTNFNGYLDEVRLTNGFGRYNVSSFAIPTARFPGR
jgi:hypothetical protein